MTMRMVTFTKPERARLASMCKVLGITFEELLHDAAIQAVDEFEGQVRSYVQRAKGKAS